MKEIGGYLELDNFSNSAYYPDAIRLNTARNALVYLVRAKNISKVYLPYYLCSSVCDVCVREGIDHEFYHVDKAFMPVLDVALKDSEYVYIVNHYGQLKEDQIRACQGRYKNIILDNVQAFFTQPIEGVDTIYSCRKFFGVPDGAYLISDAAPLPLETDVSFERARHILGRYDCEVASEYYGDFKKNEEVFDALPLMYMSRLTHNLLGAVNYARVIEAREKNWQALHACLGSKNKLSLDMPKAPYMYPLWVEDGVYIRKKLAEQKIYIPTLWPNVADSEANEAEKEYAQNILPLPIDQRYTPEDMKRMGDAVQLYLK